jgi:hypothetical protein
MQKTYKRQAHSSQSFHEKERPLWNSRFHAHASLFFPEREFSSLKSPKWVSGASHDFFQLETLHEPTKLYFRKLYHTSANPNPSFL